MKNIQYANLLGSVMYAMICTRPDLACAVSLVSRYMGDLEKENWHAVKWPMKYVSGTLQL